MLRLSGKAVYKGIVLGSVSVLKKNDQQVKRQKVEDADAEIARLSKGTNFLYKISLPFRRAIFLQALKEPYSVGFLGFHFFL
nr:hypothetical protein [uncultured Schaedlerella sp.]